MKLRKASKHSCLVLILSLLLFGACKKSGEAYKVEPLRVATETVRPGSLSAGRHYVGKVEEESSTSVSFTGMGTVTRVLVQEGQYVSKGQLVAEMDITQCENTRAAAKATLDQALDAKDRMEPLYESGAIPAVDWIDILTKVRQARASLDIANKALKDCLLMAPCSGIVGSKLMESGMTALPSQPVCTILDITKVKVKVSVPEKEIGLFAKGSTGDALVSAEALGGKTFRSTHYVRGVEGDALTHTYDVRFSVPNPEGELLPGMVVNVTLSAGEAEEPVITVPLRSVQDAADSGLFVWLAKNGKAHRQPVDTGEAEGDRIIITSGLQEGDKVIVEGYQKVSEGSEVIFN